MPYTALSHCSTSSNLIATRGQTCARGRTRPRHFPGSNHHYGHPPAAFTVVEDSANRVRAAKAAGMRCIGYQSSNSGQQDLSQADAITTDFHLLSPR